MDDRCGTVGSMAAGFGEQLYDGRVHSRPAGGCHYRCVGQGHSGAENPVASKRSLTNRTKPGCTNDQARSVSYTTYMKSNAFAGVTEKGGFRLFARASTQKRFTKKN